MKVFTLRAAKPFFRPVSALPCLQKNPHTAPDATLEDTLEQAIFQAGGILESNRGSLEKLRWQRSSRTDKSVHSLATVISMKLECDAESFVEDPEGIQLAEGINSHLPPQMRVFSVQRVTKAFSARAECTRRHVEALGSSRGTCPVAPSRHTSYNYYLPASVLGLKLDGGSEDARKLELLGRCWAAFQGGHPFHNYTVRRLYRNDAVFGGRRDSSKRRKGGALAVDSDDDNEQGVLEGDASTDDEQYVGTPAESASSSATSGIPRQQADSSDPAGISSQAGSSRCSGIGVHEGALLQRKVDMRWTEERDPRDPVVRRHYRYMEWCRSGSEAVALVPGGVPCIQLSLSGNSFMLHQIRKMVAAAVAVARGALPLELVLVSLSAPARVVLPLAPPLTLVLAGAQFAPFRESWDGRVAPSTERTGQQLELRPGGTGLQQQFWEQTLRPAINELLAAEDWALWEQELQRLYCDEAEVAALVQRHAEWQAQQAQRRQARLDGMLLEAQALENRD
ncbi:hypothetical protein N2152v2_007232 [Parachlorella kessleri]